MKIYPLILFLILFNSFSHSQNKQREFVEALINDSDSLERYVDEDELASSKRLGINYDNVKYKFMISYGINEVIKDRMKKDNAEYKIRTNAIGFGYSVTEFTVPSLMYSKQFIFKNGKWISPITYSTRNWATKTSKYFIFKISEPKYFNDYCINKLDEFVDSMAVLLEFDTQLLEKEKIYYILCSDEKEIEQITGFNMRGQFITAIDGIITTYNTHYHELAHLLMNYKLKNLSLYTLPFFMEGFAVAVGGRGGMAKRVVLDIGYFLQKSGFLTYDSTITNDGFYKDDASLTYPVAGLYNEFLLKVLGAKKYLELYKIVNCDLKSLRNIRPKDVILPNRNSFEQFLSQYEKTKCISPVTHYPRIINVPSVECDSLFYNFYIYLNMFHTPNDEGVSISNYESQLFKKLITGFKYSGEKYLVTVTDSNAINVYNLYCNELIASYDQNFSTNKFEIYKGTYYEFSISKDVFDSNICKGSTWFELIR